ncbi:MAG: hypothetical protein ABIQ12_09390 [Opitutaceae bacterium]
MKPEPFAWRALNEHAAAQLHGGFADRALRAARGPETETWRAFFARGVRSLRPGFAERVLRAARVATDIPSLASHFALSAATAAVCLSAVLFLHQRNVDAADARNLDEWRALVQAAADPDAGAL